MPVSDEQVKKFENAYKRTLFGEIDYLISLQNELFRTIKSNQKQVGIDKDIPNMGITFNNKLIELSHIFQEAGLSIYSSKIEEYGELKLNFVSSSFIGQAIIFDMIHIIEEGTDVLMEYNSELNKLYSKKQEKLKSLRNAGPIKKFLLNFTLDLSYSPEEKKYLTSFLYKYSDFDDKLWNYNLRDNIVHSLVTYITNEYANHHDIHGLIDESVVPDLEKLGLLDLLPQLRKYIDDVFKKNSWDLPEITQKEMQEYQQQLAKQYIPDSNTTNSSQEPEQ